MPTSLILSTKSLYFGMIQVMANLSDAPINAYTWTWGAIAVYAFTIKSISSYRRTKNPIARKYSLLGFWFATGMLFYGLPGFFTSDTDVLKHTYFFADVCIQISIQFGFWLSWFIGLRPYIKLKYLLGLTIPLSVLTLIIEFSTSMANVSQNPHLLQYTDAESVLILKSIMYLLVAVPLSFFLLKQVPNQNSISTKFQSLVSGLIPIIVTIAAVSNNIFDKGSDTAQSSVELAIFFTVFFIAQLPRLKRFR